MVGGTVPLLESQKRPWHFLSARNFKTIPNTKDK